MTQDDQYRLSDKGLPTILQGGGTVSSIDPTDNFEIISILKKQNDLLEQINQNLTRTNKMSDQNSDIRRVEIQDFDMRISSMISLSFKWIIASIPIGLVIFFIYWLIAALSF